MRRSSGLAGLACLLPKAVCIWIVAASLGLAPDAEAASIGGEVRFVGVVPHRPPIRVTKDQDYCGLTIPNESYLIGPSRGLKNVVVYIEQSGEKPVPSDEQREHLLDNRGCRFAPRIMVMRWGERLVVKNSDPKLHIVHSYAEKRTVFNLSLPFRDHKLDITHKIKRPALLQINCDTHNWMRAYIHVFGHPFFAVTDERGFFSIGDIPPGRYTIKAWHEEAGIQGAQVLVPEGGAVKTNFEFGK